jgi:hypothetical protein
MEPDAWHWRSTPACCRLDHHDDEARNVIVLQEVGADVVSV